MAQESPLLCHKKYFYVANGNSKLDQIWNFSVAQGTSCPGASPSIWNSPLILKGQLISNRTLVGTAQIKEKGEQGVGKAYNNKKNRGGPFHCPI